MVKYQAFIIVKAEDARGTDVVLAATLTKLFTLDYIKSLTSYGGWGAISLTQQAESSYYAWQKDWNKGNVWNDANAYIPFYLLPDYKSGVNSFMDTDGNILGEGRLKELFLQRFGVDVEYLTRKLVA